MKDLEQVFFSLILDMKPTEFKSYLSIDKSNLFPKNSKVLISHFSKILMTSESPEKMILNGHKSFHYLFGRAIFLLQGNPKNISHFKKRIIFLREKDWLTEEQFQFFDEINKLRNSIEHEVFYDVRSWNPELLPQLKKYGFVKPKRKDLVIDFSFVLIQTIFLCNFFDLSNKYEWIKLEDIPSLQP